MPTVKEIHALPWNGLRVVSLFSGCGGSCTGFRMDGYRVIYANEFVESARDSYRANYPDVPLDDRDIRTVTGASIRQRFVGCPSDVDIDVVEGSPPCAGFSTAGIRQKGWGQKKVYSDTEQRVDDLFDEYVRIIRELRPRAFVAENVSGLVKGVSRGVFLDTLSALRSCGYQVDARLLDAQWLGVPQMRQRLIFVGVRDDLKRKPVHPRPFPYRYTLRDALPWVTSNGTPSPIETRENVTGNHFDLPEHVAPSIRAFSIGRLWDDTPIGGSHLARFNLIRCAPNQPCPTVTATGGNLGAAGLVHPYEKRKWAILELKALCSFPSDFVLTGSYLRQWERLGRAVPPLMMRAIARTLREEVLACSS